MQQRAINAVLTGVTGTALAGMLVAGVAAASDDSAPGEKQFLTQEAVAAQQHSARLDKPQNKAENKAENKAGNQTPAGNAEDARKSEAAKSESAPEKKGPKALLSGTTTASYFWDDGSGINGDTGAPASGKPMQKGMFASPSWPLLTKVKVTYNGRSVTGFVGDRGPGEPSHRGIMLDLDTYTFRYLLDGGKPKSKYTAGTGEGHLKGLKWEVLEWGKGAGKKGKPQPFGS
ncbi:hypothetical protein E1200_20620 [Actinomadura sp. GC306]|uniref:hypothetical protein n=1 Tax=Actinomadura sp. GC306 TaxID=2530367 RepID=UPI00104F6D5A|nr:hypothetical protein [Actinomadura sp. GC306]TDC64261.1 hypothetical protein E1200_20620 [Actinomadura sp. GC306]